MTGTAILTPSLLRSEMVGQAFALIFGQLLSFSMDSASQPEPPPEHACSSVSSFLGVVIALITVTLPLFAIARFSSARAEYLSVPSYSLIRSR